MTGWQNSLLRGIIGTNLEERNIVMSSRERVYDWKLRWNLMDFTVFLCIFAYQESNVCNRIKALEADRY